MSSSFRLSQDTNGIAQLSYARLRAAPNTITLSPGVPAAVARMPQQPAIITKPRISPYGTRDNGNGHNWGWIGLLGLAGLAGLTRKNRDRQMADRDRNVSDIRKAA